MNTRDRKGRSTAPKLDDHPGLEMDEATEKGTMMTAVGSVGPEAEPDSSADAPERATGSDHSGLDADEATPEGKMMTALGSTGPKDEDA